MERIREELGIDRWVVFGGSWGSTLGLAYAETPSGARPGLGAPRHLPGPSQGDPVVLPGGRELRLPGRLGGVPRADPARPSGTTWSPRTTGGSTSPDPAVRAHAARAWSVWEGSTSKLHPDPKLIERFGRDTFAEAFARIECHYFAHGSFLRHPDQLLDDVERIRHIPGVIVQGRYDVVCPMVSAWELHRRWPEADFHVVPDAGHSALEPGTVDRLVEATDRFRALP